MYLVGLGVPVIWAFIVVASRNDDGVHGIARGRKHNRVRLLDVALENDGLVIVTEIGDLAGGDTV